MRSIRKFILGSGGMLLVFSMAGLPFLLVGLIEAAQNYQMLGRFTQVQGVVVENVWHPFAEQGAAYVPRVEYTDAGGTLRSFTDGIGSVPADYEVGSQVSVLYDPTGVEPPRIRSWKRIWFAPTLFVGIGLIPVAAGLAGAYITRPKYPGR
jgi:hypothetical protein